MPGTLRQTDGGELRLALSGGLTDATDRAGDTSVVFGQAEGRGERFGGSPQITLRRCLLTRDQSGPGGHRQTFLAERGYFGGHLADPDRAQLRSARFGFPLLAAWADSLTGFSRPAAWPNVEWSAPEPTAIDLPVGRLELELGAKSESTGRRTAVEESVRLTVRFPNPLTPAGIEADVLTPLQNFLSFAADRPAGLDGYTARLADDAAGELRVVGPRVPAGDNPDDEPPARGLLFTLGDLGGRLGGVLERWFRLGRTHRAALEVYFASVYGRPSYIDLRFQQLLQAVCLFHTATADAGSPAIPSDVGLGSLGPDAAADGLRRLYHTHPLVVAERAVVALTRAHAGAFGPLVPDVRKFVDQVLGTAAHALTYQAPAGEVGAGLYWMSERVGLLFKIALLDALGFPEAEARRLLGRNAVYNHLRALAARGRPS